MKTRRTQVVATKAESKTMMEWMKEEVGGCGSSDIMATKAVTKFPAIFHVYDQESMTDCLKSLNVVTDV